MIENRLLKRQLKKSDLLDSEEITHEKCVKFLSLVEAQYNSHDEDLTRLERTLELSSTELRDLNDNLEKRIHEEVKNSTNKERMLLQQSKMASLGEMLSNIAHQWRQPLSAISSQASGVKLQMDLEMITQDEIKQSFDNILKYVTFLNQTIEDFREFFRPDKEKITFFIKDAVDKSLFILTSVADKERIKIIKEIEDAQVFNLFNEFTQVILNLIKNSVDVLGDKNLDEKIIKIISKKTKHNSVILEVIDNGGGIPADIVDKIFEPYFTTKHQSQGTGLGLYMSNEIVTKHMGSKFGVTNINFEHEGKTYTGACFTIELPL